MRQEFTIGRDYKGTIMIDDTHRAVSREHAKIIIEDNDTWILQDAGSSNGTFLQQPDGTLRRVTTAQIRPTTKIQLGPPDVNGFCFPASLVLGPNVGYEYAWRELREKLEVIKADKKSFIRKAKIWGWAQKGSAAVGCVVGICLQGVFDDSMSPNAILNLNRALMVAPGLLIAGAAAMFMPDGESIKERRAKLRCPNPNCRRVLSDDEISYGMCQLCKCRPQ